MSIVRGSDLTDREKKLLFWASFLSLAAAGMGFAFRVAHQGSYGKELLLTDQQVGQVFGAALWPIAITMIGFSLFLDKTGFKMPMFVACALQLLGAVGTFMSENYTFLYLSAFAMGLGHGIVEAVINPVCAAVYPKDKTKMLTILHAAWPAGLVFGTLPIIGLDSMASVGWRAHALWMVIPVIVYGIMYLPCKFPTDERVQAGVPFMDMLKQVGFLTAFIAGGMLVYEIGNQVAALTGWKKPDGTAWFYISMGIGVGIGVIFGLVTKSIGKPLFFLLCIMMIPVATAELATDGWIKGLMTPVLDKWQVNAAFALVFSASIMLVLRIFAGPILSLANPPTVMALSGLGSAVGLWWLGSGATGIFIFVAFCIYAVGQTYYWPCILGFVSERYPQGGALTLNTVSAIGLLSAGIIGFPIMGVAFDRYNYAAAEEQLPKVAEVAQKPGDFLGVSHKAVDPGKMELLQASLLRPVASQVNDALGKLEDEKFVAKRKEIMEAAAATENKDEAWKGFEVDAASVGAVRVLAMVSKEDMEKVNADLPENAKTTLASVTGQMAAWSNIRNSSGRDVLKFAAIFPITLVVVFGCVSLYFQTQGGYKPIYLEEEEAAEAAGVPHEQAEAEMHAKEKAAHEAAEQAAGSEL